MPHLQKIRRIAGSAFVAAAALLGFLAFRPAAKLPEPEQKTAEPKAAEPEAPGATRAAEPTLPQAELALASNALASNALPSAPVGSQPAAAELRHAHPITPQHERIYRENQLTFSLDGAVEVEDVPGIRRLLAIYRQEFPEDALVLQQGYELIANCLERPREATRAEAQRFYDTELASSLRRHVRRHCLEKP
jgi:hypothetical protein